MTDILARLDELALAIDDYVLDVMDYERHPNDPYYRNGRTDGFQKVNDILTALRAQVAGMGWQPIETAPKDRLYLAYHPTYANKFWIVGYPEQSCNDFTHWMPLPQPPTGESA